MKKPLYDPKTGIHRAKGWEIALYAMNNMSTNLFGFSFLYVTYYLTGFIGISVALAGTLTTLLRIWDGITDPLIGFVLDRTNGRFGKNRPFILIGQIIMFAGTTPIFLLLPRLPQGVRLPLYIIFYMIYIIGYTCQCVVTKSAQSCLTNDPSQRPLFAAFDSIYGIFYFTGLTMFVTSTLVPKHNVLDAAGNIVTSAFTTTGFFVDMWLICSTASFLSSICAIIGLWRKDRPEFFGTGKPQKLRLGDYVDTIKNNRAIQMLIVAACSDKLTVSMQTSGVIMVMLFGIVIGDYNKYTAFTGITGLSTAVSMVLILIVARRMGQKQALLTGTWLGIGSSVVIFLMFWLGDPHKVSFAPINLYTVAFIVLFLLMRAGGGLSSSLVIPMTADCADYEVYRSGKYVPGLMGTLFSFVDKVISSFATTIIGLLLTMIGFVSEQPTQATPYSTGIFWVTMFCFIGAPIIGWILNVIAMKFYPLNKEKMAEIQGRIAEIKAEAERT